VELIETILFVLFNLDALGAGLIPVGFIVFALVMGVLLKPVVGLTGYFMSRNEEKCTGQSRHSGAAAIAFSLYDLALMGVSVGVFLMIFGILNVGATPPPSTLESGMVTSAPIASSKPDWLQFRLGAALLIACLFCQGAAILLWKGWSRKPGFLPADNLVLNLYTAFNLLTFGLVTLGLTAFCLHGGIELVLNENEPATSSRAFKTGLCLLAPALFIFSHYCMRLNFATNDAPPSPMTPLRAKAQLQGNPVAIARLLGRSGLNP